MVEESNQLMITVLESIGDVERGGKIKCSACKTPTTHFSIIDLGEEFIEFKCCNKECTRFNTSQRKGMKRFLERILNKFHGNPL